VGVVQVIGGLSRVVVIRALSSCGKLMTQTVRRTCRALLALEHPVLPVDVSFILSAFVEGVLNTVMFYFRPQTSVQQHNSLMFGSITCL
jgi:hypothetical protein